jgi:hypothetical protein
MKPTIVYDEILYTTTWLYCGCPLSEVIKDVEKHHNMKIDIDKPECARDRFDLGTCFTVPLDEANLYVIYVRRKRDIITLSHEVVHLVFRIFDDMDIPISEENQEMFARYHTFFMTKFKEGIR